MTKNRPDITSRCVYCGEPEVPAPRSCCGERHFEPVESCPDCGCEDLSVINGVSSSGLEYHAQSCRECAWIGDPS